MMSRAAALLVNWTTGDNIYLLKNKRNKTIPAKLCIVIQSLRTSLNMGPVSTVLSPSTVVQGWFLFFVPGMFLVVKG